MIYRWCKDCSYCSMIIATSICYSVLISSESVTAFEMCHKFDDAEYADTSNDDDTVRMQYQSLPYPPVTTRYMRSWEMHYKDGGRNMPYTIHPELSLDILNHYLFRGACFFRWV